uniref:Uncharacterized protein n=1 Tax=Opuntia streptacantha TaxID=393608 RepID=A0A7C9DPN0_OPUST
MMQYASSLWSYVACTLLEQTLHDKIAGAHYREKGPVSVLRTQRIKSSQHFGKGSSSLVLQTACFPANLKSITSTSNPFIKHCVKLRQNSSYRDSHGLALVIGTTLIRILEILAHYLDQLWHSNGMVSFCSLDAAIHSTRRH